MNYVASIDFWFTSNGDIPLSPRTPEQLSMLPITSRYRLCRTANAVKTPIVTFEDTLWCPEEERGKFQCPEPGCRNPTSVWRWGHVRGANRPIVSCPSHSLDANALPIPGSEVRIPCVVAHWTRLDAREILHREKALIFDIGVPDRGWALLEVRPPNVWRNIVLQWAENYLETAGPLSEFVEYIDVSHLSPGDHSVFGAQVLPIIVELFYRSGSSIISGKVVEGVCLPEYQLGEAIAAMPCTNDYPLVSDILEDEVLEDHSGEDNPEEDAMSDETYYFPDIMATWNIVNGFNRWHSCD
ncbi:hypothetical protein QBC41DRAFT_341258 [Cercophora samala]|uniref:Uncharacterized protein n=1 Tax=Cercophora samala TaxID=330535 RepID=A0AA39YWF8_9PEZI|nr:hypothetical protein QBC41DRAFT_341258 [Cercophora samala]